MISIVTGPEWVIFYIGLGVCVVGGFIYGLWKSR
jgi:hypothetical protein